MLPKYVEHYVIFRCNQYFKATWCVQRIPKTIITAAKLFKYSRIFRPEGKIAAPDNTRVIRLDSEPLMVCLRQECLDLASTPTTL